MTAVALSNRQTGRHILYSRLDGRHWWKGIQAVDWRTDMITLTVGRQWKLLCTPNLIRWFYYITSILPSKLEDSYTETRRQSGQHTYTHCSGLSTSPQVLSEFQGVVWRRTVLTQLTSSQDTGLIRRALSVIYRGRQIEEGGVRWMEIRERTVEMERQSVERKVIERHRERRKGGREKHEKNVCYGMWQVRKKKRGMWLVETVMKWERQRENRKTM